MIDLFAERKIQIHSAKLRHIHSFDNFLDWQDGNFLSGQIVNWRGLSMEMKNINNS